MERWLGRMTSPVEKCNSQSKSMMSFKLEPWHRERGMVRGFDRLMDEAPNEAWGCGWRNLNRPRRSRSRFWKTFQKRRRSH